MNPVLDNIVKVSFVVLIGLCARLLMRRRSAAVRHWVLSTAIICAVITPVLGMIVPAWRVGLQTTFDVPSIESTSSISTIILPAGQAVTDGRPSVAPVKPGSAGPSFAVVASAVWAAGAGIGLLLLIVGLAHLRGVASGARRLESERWVTLSREVAAALGLRRPVVLLQSRHPTLLVTWGLVRPKVILPEWADDWSDDKARVVLRHELAHIRRGDWAVFMAAEVLRAVYWFNPLVWIALRRVRQESEHACDDTVLNAGIDGSEYATHLLDLARTLYTNHRRSFPPFPAPAMARPSSLEGRISAMLNTRVDRSPLTRFARLTTVLAVLLLAGSIAGFGAQTFNTFSGVVLDPTNRFLPGAKLVITNAASEAKHEVRSDPTGRFEFVGLPPGEYALDVRLPGFSNLKDTIAVIGRDIDRTIRLEVGSLEETITVTGPTTGSPDPEPVDQAERRQQARSRAEARQRAVLESCAAKQPGPMGGEIVAPIRLTNVNPRYPENLRTAGIGGVVTMEAVIGLDGNIQEVKAITSPHPDLSEAAIQAVHQWQYTPTLLNCTPIEVHMQVTTRFTTQ